MNEMVQTSECVRQQIEAMKAEIFEPGLFRLASAAGGLDTGMLPRAWLSETLLRSIAWLRLENMRGAASYTAKGDAFVAEKPRVWLAKLGGTDWDLAPDGKRVAVVTPEGSEAPKQEHEVAMLLNFADDLRRKVPAGK
jgi:hypothetical protein